MYSFTQRPGQNQFVDDIVPPESLAAERERLEGELVDADIRSRRRMSPSAQRFVNRLMGVGESEAELLQSANVALAQEIQEREAVDQTSQLRQENQRLTDRLTQLQAEQVRPKLERLAELRRRLA